MAAAEYQEWSTRTIKPGFEYKLPEVRVDLYSLKEEELEEAINATNKDSVVKFLAVDLGLSGTYAEEICLRARIDKNKEPKKATDEERKGILETIKAIMETKPNPVVFLKNSEITDAVPFELEIYSGLEKRYFESYGEAIEFASPKEKISETQARINNIKRIISEQEAKMAEMEKEAEESRRKGELIYENYAKVKSALSKGKYGKISVEL